MCVCVCVCVELKLTRTGTKTDGEKGKSLNCVCTRGVARRSKNNSRPLAKSMPFFVVVIIFSLL